MTDNWGSNDKVISTANFGENDQVVQDGALSRGFKKMKQNVALSTDITTGDTTAAAKNIKDSQAYALANPGMKESKPLMDAWNRGDGVFGGIKEVGSQVANDYRKAEGFVSGAKAVGRDLRAMGEGVVEQAPNMIAPMTGQLAGAFTGARLGAMAGGAAGSAFAGVGAVPGAAIGGTIGGIAGAFTGSTAGNAALEVGQAASDGLVKAGIDPNDTVAVKAYLDQNRGDIVRKGVAKGAIIGAVDTATMGAAHSLLTAPAKAAADRALTGMGVDVADQVAVKSAMKSDDFAARVGADTAYQASKQGAGNIARNVGAAALEPAGEFAGEYLGEGLAKDNWDTKNAALEALSSLGQSGATFAGQKVYQYATDPRSAKESVTSNTQPEPIVDQQPAGPMLALPAPTYNVGSDGVVMTTADQNAAVQAQADIDAKRYTGDPADKTPVPNAAPTMRDVAGTDLTIQDLPIAQPVAPKLSEQMGIDPNAGTMSAAAAIAVDSGAHQQVAEQQAQQQAVETAQKQGKGGQKNAPTGDLAGAAQQAPSAAELQAHNIAFYSARNQSDIGGMIDAANNAANAGADDKQLSMYTGLINRERKDSATPLGTPEQAASKAFAEQAQSPAKPKETLAEHSVGSDATNTNSQAQQWDGMSKAERKSVLSTTDIHPIVSTTAWDSISPKVKEKLSAIMQSQDVTAQPSASQRTEQPTLSSPEASVQAQAKVAQAPSTSSAYGKDDFTAEYIAAPDQAAKSALFGKATAAGHKSGVVAGWISDTKKEAQSVVASEPVETKVSNSTPLDSQPAKTASWAVKDKATGDVVMETFDKKKVDALNTDKYEAVPILDHLQGVNKAIKEADTNPTIRESRTVETAPALSGEPTPELVAKPTSTQESFPQLQAKAKAKKVAKMKNSVAFKHKEKARSDYFKAGNIVKSYGGTHDRVISYNAPDENGNWSVNVQSVEKKGGEWVANGDVRTHQTEPDVRELKVGVVDHSPDKAVAIGESKPTVNESLVVSTVADEPTNKENLSVESKANSHTDIKSESGVTHSIPSSLIDQTHKLSDVVSELASMRTDSQDSEGQREFTQKLLSEIASINPDVKVRVVQDLNQVDDPMIRSGLKSGGYYDPKTNTAYIYPNAEEWEGNASNLLNHELVHAVTEHALRDGKAPKETLDRLDGIRAKIKDYIFNNHDQLSAHILDRLFRATQNNDELLSVALGEHDVNSTLKDNGVVVDADLNQLNDTIKQINIQEGSITHENESGSVGIGQGDDTQRLSGTESGGSTETQAPDRSNQGSSNDTRTDANREADNGRDEGKQSVDNAKSNQSIQDFGEKIGGARKDQANAGSGKKGTPKTSDSRPAWMRRFEINQIASSSKESEVGRWVISDKRKLDWTGNAKRMQGSYATKEEAEAAIPLVAVAQKHRVVASRHGEQSSFEIWRDISDRKRVKVVDKVFDTRVEALEYMAQHAEEIIETNTTFGEADLPRPENTVRTGVERRTAPVKDRDFMDTFGFRGVEFGNWNNQTERQELLDDAYDGLMDLADVMGIPPKAISLNGDLGLAFGARGQGLSGARAHYEQGKAVINLTKMNGAGSLAHEWFHALDHYFGRQDGKASAEWVVGKDGTRSLKPAADFGSVAVSSGFRGKSEVRQEVRDAYNNVMQTMFKKAETYVEDTAKVDNFVAGARHDVEQRLASIRNELSEQKDPKYYKRNNKPATAEQLAAFDAIAEQILQGVNLEVELKSVAPVRNVRSVMSSMRWTNDALEQLSTIYKAVRGRNGFNSEQTGTFDRLRANMTRYSARLKMLSEAQSGTEKTKNIPTDFAMNAKELDQGRGTDYWTTPHEMAARAFQGYVEDKIAESGGKSPFLNHAPANVGIPTPWGWKRPYPHGEERTAINAAFDKLVDAIDTRETDKGIALFSRNESLSELATTEPLQNVDQVRKTLVDRFGADAVAKLEKDGKLEIVPRHTDNDVEGFYLNGKTTLVAGNLAESDVIPTFLHELGGHAGMQGVMKPAVYNELMRNFDAMVKAGNPLAIEAQKRAMVESDPKTQRDELLPYLITVASKTQDKKSGAYQAIQRLIQRTISAVKAWAFDNYGISMTLTPNDMVALAERMVNKVTSTSESNSIDLNNPIMFSRSGVREIASDRLGQAIKAVTVQNIKDRTDYKLTDWMGLSLQALGRRQITEIYSKMLPQLPTYNRLVEQMDADKNDDAAQADGLVRRWEKLKDERQLAEVMHDSTLAQIDPDKDNIEVTPEKKIKYIELKKRFDALSADAQKVYREARDSYTDHHRKVLDAIKERIERSELKGEKKAALLKQMDDDFFHKIKGVYFPLSRFGKYTVLVRNAEGKVESVSRAETMAEAQELRKNLLTAHAADKGFAVDRVMLSKEFIASRDMVGRGFMTELYAELDKQNIPAKQKAELEDTLGQLYLSSLPDLSWAKHGIHRKGTAGFSQDARRAFAQNTMHGASYLAKLRYSDLLADELDGMQKTVDQGKEVETFDQPKAQRVVDEMNKRHESLMNPKANSLSTALTSFGFVYHLGLSPASAMVNLLQTALVAYPIMGAKWGFNKSSAALLKASQEAIKGSNDISKALKGDELAAYEEAVRRGIIDVTMAHDLAGVAQGEDSGVMWKMRPVMRAASFLFHNAERFNRQVTFVAAYRLAREAGTKHDVAFDQAADATYKGHFDYSAGNRPRIMQGNAAKVLLLFKQFGQNMVFLLGRQAHQAIYALDPKDRSQARKTLSGVLAMHALAAGGLGLPFVTTILAIASMIGGDDDDPWDAEVALRNMLADTFGVGASEVLSKGLSRLTPWDISGRVGLQNMIIPDIQEGLEGQRLSESAMAAALGPVAGIGTNVLKGFQSMGDGQFGRGIEMMMPSAIRAPLKSIRYAMEGAQDKTGITIKDDVGIAGVLGQAAGFSPSDVQTATEGKSAIKAMDTKLSQRRQHLLTEFARAAIDKDQESMNDARMEIKAFNEVNPTRRIQANNMMQSVKARKKREAEAEHGVYLPRKHRDVMDEGRFAFVE